MKIVLGPSILKTMLCLGKEHAEQENLKEMGDVSSGMASAIIQIFLKVRTQTICFNWYCLFFIEPRFISKHFEVWRPVQSP